MTVQVFDNESLHQYISVTYNRVFRDIYHYIIKINLDPRCYDIDYLNLELTDTFDLMYTEDIGSQIHTISHGFIHPAFISHFLCSTILGDNYTEDETSDLDI